MNSPKRHHYLPQCYLYGFSENGFLWTYDRERDVYSKQSPHNTAVENHRYSFVDKEGKNDTSIETGILSVIDGWYAPLVTKIDSGVSLTEEDKDQLSIFVSHLWFRVPDYEKQYNELAEGQFKHILRFIYSSGDKGRRYHERFSQTLPDDERVSFDEIRQSIEDDRDRIIPHRNEYLKTMVEMSPDVAGYFRQMEWLIFHPVRGSTFVCSDSPFVRPRPTPMTVFRAPGSFF